MAKRSGEKTFEIVGVEKDEKTNFDTYMLM